ncbi:MAG: NUDIX hydrolase [Pseudomonadota bacterium]
MHKKDSRVLAQGKHLRLINDSGWEYVDRVSATGVVIIVAVTDKAHLLLIEQFRRPVNNNLIELPAGLAGDNPGESNETLEEAAKRELFEETGYQAEAMQFLVEGPLSAGLSSEIVTFFRATGLTKVGPGGGDNTESIKVYEVPLKDVPEWLNKKKSQGISIDPKVYAALYFAAL